MWTKGDVVRKAFSELSIAGYVYDLDPDELQDALSSLDAMMGEWDGRGIRLGYPIPDTMLGSTMLDAMGIPSYATRAVYMNLAVHMAAGQGKVLKPQQAITAKQGYDLLLSKAASPQPTQYPNTLPLGAGNRRWAWSRNYFPTPVDNPIGSDDSGLTLLD